MIKTIGCVAVLALALGAAGCERRERQEKREGGTRTETGTARQPQAGAEEAMKNYRVDRLEVDEVVLVPHGAGEMEPQAGEELRITKEEFQRLSGSEAKEGDTVKIRIDATGKPEVIQKTGGMEPAGTPPGQSGQ